jgi:hypothetical protein
VFSKQCLSMSYFSFFTMAFVVSFWLIALITLSVLFSEEEEVKRVVIYDHFCLFKGLLHVTYSKAYMIILFV